MATTHDVYRDTDTEEEYVATAGGYMLVEDYTDDGGRVERPSEFGDMEYLGAFTDQEMIDRVWDR